MNEAVGIVWYADLFPGTRPRRGSQPGLDPGKRKHVHLVTIDNLFLYTHVFASERRVPVYHRHFEAKAKARRASSLVGQWKIQDTGAAIAESEEPLILLHSPTFPVALLSLSTTSVRRAVFLMPLTATESSVKTLQQQRHPRDCTEPMQATTTPTPTSQRMSRDQRGIRRTWRVQIPRKVPRPCNQPAAS